LFGTYEYFPEIYHGVANFSYTTPTKKLQRILIELLYQINQRKGGLNFPEFTRQNIKVELEIGIADGLTFNYLDREVLKQYQEKYSRKVFPKLDFLCIARYYVTKKKHQSSLRFDYYMLRFLFNKKKATLRVYHEKGTRRLPIGDLIRFLMEKINQELSREKSSPIQIDYMHAL